MFHVWFSLVWIFGLSAKCILPMPGWCVTSRTWWPLAARGRLQTPRPGLAWMQSPWPALHGCMAGSGDGSGDEVKIRYGLSRPIWRPCMPCFAPGEGNLEARVFLVCDLPSNDSLITSTGVTCYSCNWTYRYPHTDRWNLSETVFPVEHTPVVYKLCSICKRKP